MCQRQEDKRPRFTRLAVEAHQSDPERTKMELSISQISEETGLSADTLRYYEKEGILVAKRKENGYRYYDESDLTDLKYLIVMKYAGFTLAEIKSLEITDPITNSSAEGSTEDCATAIKNLITAKISELKLAIKNYQKIAKLLEASLSIVECPESIPEKSKAMDEYIGQIFNDIQKGEFIKP
jgi:MerR family Zn(II)-responsive transcriptional regulator of zntA